ncbi:hypothetical protein CDAR_29811 [Caerostris darwini]|uniref:Uncharacterized protein n=1 Tax=Caerostris darwini TaxID=1538125 RepID=A0AAV4QUB9_9ARAC|nr:hypothetical protein CDAR_29811 [Caerostris darwini]
MAYDVVGKKKKKKDGRGTLNPNREKLQTIINKTAQTVTQHPPEERFGGSFEGGWKEENVFDSHLNAPCTPLCLTSPSITAQKWNSKTTPLKKVAV